MNIILASHGALVEAKTGIDFFNSAILEKMMHENDADSF